MTREGRNDGSRDARWRGKDERFRFLELRYASLGMARGAVLSPPSWPYDKLRAGSPA